MPESETSKVIREVIKLADKLIQDLKKGAEGLREAARKLRGEEKKDDEEETGE